MAETVIITERHDLGIATIMARKGIDGAAIGAALGLTLPSGPGAVFSDRLMLVGTGPGTWLAVTDQAGDEWASHLRQYLTGLASVSDQSGAYSVLRITGADARTLLKRGAYLDLDPEAFGPGSAAATTIAHIGVILWQIDSLPTFDLALFRSYETSFRHWLDVKIASL